MTREGGYRTRQRELILQYLTENRDRHILADDIVEHLKANGTAVGKSTVYRYLDKLVEQQAVRKYLWEEGKSACYQYTGGSSDCRQHFHLKCTGCGELFHVECDYLNEIAAHMRLEHGFAVDSSRTVLYGVCAACRRDKQERGENG